MSSDGEEYDIMAPRRKTTPKPNLLFAKILDDDDPSSPSNFISDKFQSNLRQSIFLENSDSENENEVKPTRNFFDDVIDTKKESILGLDKSIESKVSDEIPRISKNILLEKINYNKNECDLKPIASEPLLPNFIDQKPSYTADFNVSQVSDLSSNFLVKNIYNQKNDESKIKIPSIIEENLNLKTKLSRTSVDLRLISEKMEEKPQFKETIDRFLLNKSFWFDLFKAKRDKINLLNEALKSHDGNAILAVVLFLRRTLSSQIFFEILINYPRALNQYSFYLKQIKDNDQLVALEKFQENFTETATILSFAPVICDRKLPLNEKLKIFYDFERLFNLKEINQIKSSIVYEAASKHLTLLKIQKEILKNRSTISTQNETKQLLFDQLYENTVWCSISFCLKYGKEIQANQLYSIEHFKQEFSLTDKEFAIFFIKSMCEISQWSEISKFLNTSKSLFNIIQKQNVCFETIVSIIYYSNGPEEQIKKYLSMIEDLENKKKFALKLRAYDIAIDVYRQQKDRVGLYMILTNLEKNSVEYANANKLLQDDKIKWKN